MSLSRLLAHQSELAAAPDRMTEGWLRGVADNILEEIWERTGEGPVFSERQRVYQMAYDREVKNRRRKKAACDEDCNVSLD